MEWLARRVYFAMLYVARRPAIRRMQDRSIAWMPPRWQSQARASLLRQNRFARSIGLPLTRLMVFLVVFSVSATLIYLAVMEMISRGMLEVPREAIPTQS
jgi:hypothetical protein